MPTPTLEDTKVASLVIQMANGDVTGLNANMEYHLRLEGMDVPATKMQEIWSQMNQSRKDKFQTFVNWILGL